MVLTTVIATLTTLGSTSFASGTIADCDSGDAPVAYETSDCQSVATQTGALLSFASETLCPTESITARVVARFGGTHDLVGFGECSGGTKFCCTWDGGDGDVEFVELVGTDGNDTLGFSYRTGQVGEENLKPWDLSTDDHYGYIHGGDGDDLILGSNAAVVPADYSDYLYGEGGDDVIQGNDDSDYLSGGGGDDEIEGGNGGDQLSGGTGEDTLKGQGGDDDIQGGPGVNELHGGAGTDYLCDSLGHPDPLDECNSGLFSNCEDCEGNDLFDPGPGFDYVWYGSQDDLDSCPLVPPDPASTGGGLPPDPSNEGHTTCGDGNVWTSTDMVFCHDLDLTVNPPTVVPPAQCDMDWWDLAPPLP